VITYKHNVKIGKKGGAEHLAFTYLDTI